MSKLTKLNLLGLVHLSDIICDLKINHNIDEALKAAKNAIKEVNALNQQFHGRELGYSKSFGMGSASYGIAS